MEIGYKMDYQTGIKKAKGYGSANEGVHHWWMQRITALGNIIAVIWLISSACCLAGSDYEAVRAYFATPFHASMMVFFILNVGYHAILGITVVFEDYLHSTWLKLLKIIGTKLLFSLLIIFSILSVLIIAMGR